MYGDQFGEFVSGYRVKGAVSRNYQNYQNSNGGNCRQIE